MPDLIRELCDEHAGILAKLAEARLVIVDGEALTGSLRSLQKALIDHLTKEDARLYPALRDAARTQPRLASLLENFAKDMGEVTTSVLEFYRRLDTGELQRGLVTEFSALGGRLRARIANEERFLYPEFTKLSLERRGKA